MNSTAANIRNRFAAAQTEMRNAEAEVRRLEETCPHKYGKTYYDPIVKEGYHIAGDPPGVGGCCHQFPMDVPPQEIKRWTRVCETCGKEDRTLDFEPSKAIVPVFKSDRR